MNESMTQEPRKRPLGVSIIAVLDIIAGLIVVIGAALGFLGLGLAGERLPAAIDAVAGIVLGLGIIFGIGALIVGWGLWTLKAWAFWATVVLEILTILQHVLGWLLHRVDTASLVSGLLIPVIIVVYLLADPNVRAAFRT